MSATDWTTCPKCVHLHEEMVKAELVKLAAAYGKVSQNDYKFMESEIEALKKTNMDSNLREDYWQRLDSDGVYRVSYRCTCEVCDFTFKYEHTERAIILKAQNG